LLKERYFWQKSVVLEGVTYYDKSDIKDKAHFASRKMLFNITKQNFGIKTDGNHSDFKSLITPEF